jgi:hypothetical protein
VIFPTSGLVFNEVCNGSSLCANGMMAKQSTRTCGRQREWECVLAHFFPNSRPATQVTVYNRRYPDTQQYS